jgi:hypothetical protein
MKSGIIIKTGLKPHSKKTIWQILDDNWQVKDLIRITLSGWIQILVLHTDPGPDAKFKKKVKYNIIKNALLTFLLI